MLIKVTTTRKTVTEAISFGLNPAVWRRLSVLEIPLYHLEDLVDILHAPTETKKVSNSKMVVHKNIGKICESVNVFHCLIVLL